MRVLVACECSGVVRTAFAALGHFAVSCDLKDARAPHIQDDAAKIAYMPGWDLIIAHPPCTHLSVSGAWRFKAKRRTGQQQRAIKFFMAMANAPAKLICIENPVGIMSTHWRKPDQYVQPYQYGDDASKNTGLWLKGLPKLQADPANFVPPRMVCQCGRVYPYNLAFSSGCPTCGPGHAKPRWANQCDSGQNKLGPSPTRAAARAKTYQGIAKAMADQWGITPT